MTTQKNGFTLIEALLSTMILAVGAMVVCGLSKRCVVNNVRGWEYEQAYRLADECLDRLATDEDRKWTKEERIEGDFGQRFENYKYQITIEPSGGKEFSADDLYKVTAFVYWEVAGQKYQVQASTLIYDY